METDRRLHELRRALARPLPGDAVKAALAPRPSGGRVGAVAPPSARPAAVLMLLVPDGGGLQLPLLLRESVEGDVHSGQIALPGGGSDPGEDAVTTALREAHEELAIDPRTVDVLGILSPQWIPVSGYVVTPVVGTCAQRPTLFPDPAEVAGTLWTTVERLQSQPLVWRPWERAGVKLQRPGWELEEGFLWGATAMMLAELLALIPRD
jgi:8-oxo-dGTP pyrophosphatase MutT (NUDIX family)